MHWFLVFATGVLYLLIQFTVFSHDRYFEWDEAVYYSQASAQIQTIAPSAHKARGIAYIIAPLAWAGAELPIIRISLAVLSAFLLVCSFGLWIKIIGIAAPLGAAIFSSSWLVLFYGSEISPNLLIAFLALAAVGYIGRLSLEASTGWDGLGLFLSTAGLNIVRPFDSIVITFALCMGSIYLNGFGTRKSISVFLLIAIGFLFGSIPWILESFAQFGGVLERLSTAHSIVTPDTITAWGIALEHLYLLDGPLMGPDRIRSIPITQIGYIVALFGFSSVVCYRILRGGNCSRVVCISVFVAVFFWISYVALIDQFAPRFLLPSYALLSIPAATGMVLVLKWVSNRRVASIIIYAVTAALCIHWFSEQLAISSYINREQMNGRESSRELGIWIMKKSEGKPCLFGSQYGHPQIAVTSGCKGMRYIPHDDSSANLLLERGREFDAVFRLTIIDPGRNDYLEWTTEAVKTSRGKVWYISTKH